MASPSPTSHWQSCLIFYWKTSRLPLLHYSSSHITQVPLTTISSFIPVIHKKVAIFIARANPLYVQKWFHSILSSTADCPFCHTYPFTNLQSLLIICFSIAYNRLSILKKPSLAPLIPDTYLPYFSCILWLNSWRGLSVIRAFLSFPLTFFLSAFWLPASSFSWKCSVQSYQ